MSYRNLRKRQNECRDTDTLKMILEDALVELEDDEKRLNSIPEYKKIEEDLGIDLITFMEVRCAYFKEKIVYIRRKNKLISGTIKYIGEKTIWISYYNKQNFTYPIATLKLKDYSKTWALTREELE